jgi:hypothetical protein
VVAVDAGEKGISGHASPREYKLKESSVYIHIEMEKSGEALRLKQGNLTSMVESM